MLRVFMEQLFILHYQCLMDVLERRGKSKYVLFYLVLLCTILYNGQPFSRCGVSSPLLTTSGGSCLFNRPHIILKEKSILSARIFYYALRETAAWCACIRLSVLIHNGSQ